MIRKKTATNKASTSRMRKIVSITSRVPCATLSNRSTTTARSLVKSIIKEWMN